MSANQPVERAATLEDVRAEVLAPERLNAFVVSGFAGIALLIAVVGVAGVLAFSVSARTREFGVRLAIGSTPRHLLLKVLSEGAVIVAIGIVAGAAGGYAFATVAASYFENLRLPGAAAGPRRRHRARGCGRVGVAPARGASRARRCPASAQVGVEGDESLMDLEQTAPRKPMRLWPGVTAVVAPVAGDARSADRRSRSGWDGDSREQSSSAWWSWLWWLFFSRARVAGADRRDRPDGHRRWPVRFVSCTSRSPTG